MNSVAVVDYGVGNLFSVCRALEHCGVKATLVDTQDAIADATILVLPGVGAFADGMAGLRERGLDKAIIEYAKNGHFLLGICLGMQMLLEVSEEFGSHQGLGIIKGRVAPIPPLNLHTQEKHKIPHIGWKPLIKPSGSHSWQQTILNENETSRVYFTHSYCAYPDDDNHRLADYLYNGQRISAAIRYGNIFGCQFHPEKSGKAGLQILKNFLRLAGINLPG